MAEEDLLNAHASHTHHTQEPLRLAEFYRPGYVAKPMQQDNVFSDDHSQDTLKMAWVRALLPLPGYPGDRDTDEQIASRFCSLVQTVLGMEDAPTVEWAKGWFEPASSESETAQKLMRYAKTGVVESHSTIPRGTDDFIARDKEVDISGLDLEALGLL
jgi:hypothetical protein